MVTESITIANLKCQGCENSITKELLSIPGVENVSVNMNQIQ
jgi:copper chaperone CopZ